MTDPVKLVLHNTRPAIICFLADEASDDPVDLTGASVVMHFRYAEDINIQATVPGTVLDGPNGKIVFFPASAPEMLEGDPGPYQGEVVVTFPDGQVQTMYDIIKFKVRENFA